ncbi:MAG: MFS transporter, partial [Nocardioidaceae bacterium]|nr:MFS transporter [Nocardioidaceae bacterium]
AVGAAGIQLAGQRSGVTAVVAAVLGLALVAVALPPLMPPGFFRFGRGLPPVITVRALVAGAFFGAEAFVPLMLVEQRGLGLLLAGSALTVGSLGWTVGSWLQSRRFVRLRRDRLITLGAGCVWTGVTVVALVGYLEWWVGLVAVAWVVAGFGMGIAIASTSVATMTLSSTGDQGRNSSSLQFGEAFGGGLFIGVGGALFATLHPSGDLDRTFGTVLAAMAVVALLALLASLRTGRIRSPAT